RPAELLHALAARADVVDVVVDASAGAIGLVDRAAGVLREARHVVRRRAPLERLQLPAEEVAVERHRALDVASADLDVDGLSCHLSSFRPRSGADANGRLYGETTNGTGSHRQHGRSCRLTSYPLSLLIGAT